MTLPQVANTSSGPGRTSRLPTPRQGNRHRFRYAGGDAFGGASRHAGRCGVVRPGLRAGDPPLVRDRSSGVNPVVMVHFDP